MATAGLTAAVLVAFANMAKGKQQVNTMSRAVRQRLSRY
jgi:hypothetical protein